MNKIFSLLLLFTAYYTSAQEKSYTDYRKVPKAEVKMLSMVNSEQQDIGIALFKKLDHLPVRIVFDHENKVFYTCDTYGWVFKIPLINGMAGEEIKFLTPDEHHINYLQGMAFYNNTLILVGNHNDPANSNGYGVVEKCVILTDGGHQWTTMLTTEIYPSSGTLFDHGFSGVCLSPGKDSVYISSGSRTDHGEVKNSGSYTGLRDIPLTAKIFRISVNASNLYLPNDEQALNEGGYVFARGTRNEFDMAFTADGKLFGIENSGDRDDPEELNWLRQNHHYGFPWRMGGNNTPMQYATYDAAQDKLIPEEVRALNNFYNDPQYPARPTDVVFAEPVKNLGPDANWVRNPDTGAMYQSSDITTFTGHRAPLGLVFDADSSMQIPYTGSGFMLAYSPERAEGGYSPEQDRGGDLCQLRLSYDSVSNNYVVNTTRLITGFFRLTDAEKVGNELFITDFLYNIWKVTLPGLAAPVANFAAAKSPECLSRFSFENQSANEPMTYHWDFGDGATSTEKNPVHQYVAGGNYTVTLKARNPQGSTLKEIIVSVPEPLLLSQTINDSINFKGAVSIQATNMINNGANVLYRAAKNIMLEPGFKVDSGAVFISQIGECNN